MEDMCICVQAPDAFQELVMPGAALLPQPNVDHLLPPPLPTHTILHVPLAEQINPNEEHVECGGDEEGSSPSGGNEGDRSHGNPGPVAYPSRRESGRKKDGREKEENESDESEAGEEEKGKEKEKSEEQTPREHGHTVHRAVASRSRTSAPTTSVTQPQSDQYASLLSSLNWIIVVLVALIGIVLYRD